MKKLVIIPGGFHPFHAGHKALYDSVRDAFPSADVYVAATADTSARPFPFEMKKKLARIAGIDGHRFIQVKSPFRAEEITQHYDPANTVLIFARSEKDRDQQPRAGGVKKDGTQAYLQPLKRNGLQPMNQHGYMTYLPTVQFGPGMTSATEIRAKWPSMDDEQKVRLVQQLYPDTQTKTKLADVIVKMFDHVIAPEQKTDEGLAKTLATGALASAMAMGTPAQAADLTGYNTGYLEKIVITNRPANGISPQQAKKELRRRIGSQDPHTQPPSANFEKKYLSQRMEQNGVEEARLVNDPDAGHQIIPDGGMGTWDEDTMVSNLARKFGDMVNMVKGKNYTGLQYVLYKGGVVKGLVDALAEYERFMQKQGRRPIARGREIDMSVAPVNENPDYIDEGEVVQFPTDRSAPPDVDQAHQLATQIIDIAKDETIADPGPRLAPLRQELQRLGYRLRMDNGGMRLIHNVTNWNTIIDPMK